MRKIITLTTALLVACGSPADEGPGTVEGPESDQPPVGTADLPAGAERAPVDHPMPDHHIALDGEGIRIITPTGSTRLVPFGVPTDQVAEVLENIWGPPGERIELPDCGYEPPVLVAWGRGLNLLSVGGVFAGWSTRENGSPAAPGTMAGLAIGATRRDVEAAYDLEITETAAGTEFQAGGIYGVFADASPDARVVSLWAGRACIFR